MIRGNVRRNLPVPSEATKSGNSFSMENKRHDSNNNNKMSTKSENHCNERRKNSFSQSLHLDLDWYQKKKVKEMASESSTLKKSVSFSEPLILEHDENYQVEVPKKLNSILTADNREKVNRKPLQPALLSSALSTYPKFVDKYERVDGYTERHLFMGKGARLKEQEFLKLHGFHVGKENVKYNSSKKDSQNVAIEAYKKGEIKPQKVKLQKSNDTTKYQNYRNSVCDQSRDDRNTKEEGSKNCQVSQGSKDIFNEKQNLRNT